MARSAAAYRPSNPVGALQWLMEIIHQSQLRAMKQNWYDIDYLLHGGF